MKKITLILAVLMVSVFGYAQPPGGGRGQMNSEEAIKQQTEQMVKDLSLNADQTKKVEAINKKYGEKNAQAFQNAGEDRTQMRETMQKLRTEKTEELKKVLTAEQFKKHEELEEQRMQQRRQGMGGQGGPGGQGGAPTERRGAPRGNN
jgi:Spy/CpxP family protein refolding chaperone